MDADEDLDYDDIISQNILIRKEDESPDKNRTVEILKKQSENYESQYNRQAALYQMDENPQQFLETSINEQDSMDDESSSEGSEFGDFVPRASIVEDEDSSDSDWERDKCRVKVNKGSFKCDECEKRCATKRGLDLHKRSHVRHKLKSAQVEQMSADGDEAVEKVD